MSLQVWLPLNGNLNNQGLSNITFTGTPTWKTSGKIGASALNLSSRITFNCPELNGTKYFSVCFWGMTESNPDSTANWMDLFALSDKTADGATAGTFRFETGYGAAAYGGIHWHDNATNAIINGSYTYNTASEFGQWHHICITVSDTQVCSYYDGILKQTHTSGLGGGFITGAGWIGETTTRGGIQDIRIYDHTLSKKEVEEISKGLVLHYKLDNNGQGRRNILLGTNKKNFSTTANSANDRDKGQFSVGSGGNGTFSVTEEQVPVGRYSYNVTNNTSGNRDFQQGHIPYIEGQKYTGSWWAKGSGTCLYRSWNRTAGSQVFSKTYTLTSNWTFYSYTFTATAAQATDDCTFHLGVTGNSSIQIAGMKLELGDKATSYSQAPEDLGEDSNIIYDSSGYQNHGTLVGTLPFISDTARYNISASFNGTTRIERITLNSEVKTLSCWARTSKNKSTSQQMVSDSASALTISFYNGTIIGVFGTTRGTGSKCTLGSSYKENDWNHFVVVKTGDSGERNIYCNGVQLTPTSNDYWSAATGFWIGARNSSNGNPFFGEICDIRAYVTALTAEQVKELYDTSATIDKNGNVYAREVQEI